MNSADRDRHGRWNGNDHRSNRHEHCSWIKGHWSKTWIQGHYEKKWHHGTWHPAWHSHGWSQNHWVPGHWNTTTRSNHTATRDSGHHPEPLPHLLPSDTAATAHPDTKARR
ncbi:hypothetical protein [Streptomyces sp. NPDC048357]|uniref:hypothetical protein n=1 Tax=Streptomyces sp. NPDC048357 TaxID=3154719 RepID=UPI00343373EB